MLKIQHLYKSYGHFQAVDDLNLQIEKGTSFGFVGPNGAGKTTTMKMIAGLLLPDKGEIYIDGIDVVKSPDELKEKIGYMPDFFGVYDNLRVMEYMEFYASMYGLAGKDIKKRCLQLIEMVNLSGKENAYVDSLSRGMKQRLCLARSLVHEPQLLILDEPASGLDPRARYEMKEIIKKLTALGKTIMISSHILPELKQMCNYIGIMEHGSLVMEGDMQQVLEKAHQTSDIRIQILDGQEQMITLFKEDHRVQHFSMRQNEFVVNFYGDEKEEARLLRTIIEQGIEVSRFNKEAGDLETLFMRLTEDAKEAR